MRISILLLSMVIGVISFSMNPVTDTYESTGELKTEKIIDSKNIRIFRSTNIENDYKTFYSDGYEVIGYSNLESFEIPESNIRSQAKKVGSEQVIYSETFINRKNTTEWDSHIKNTCYKDGKRTTDCPDGGWIKVSKDYFSYNVLFLNKVELNGLGLLIRELSIEKKKEIESNFGLEILSVRKDSEAYMKNVLPGDVISAIDKNKISSEEDYKNLIKNSKGKVLNVQLLRKGKLVNIELQVH